MLRNEEDDDGQASDGTTAGAIGFPADLSHQGIRPVAGSYSSLDNTANARQSAQLPQRPANLASDLCWLLSRATERQEREFGARALAASGLTARKHHVLMAAMDSQRTQNELARAVGIDTTTMVSTLDELERAGLAERHISPTDRRMRIVKVTPAGVRAVKKCDRALRATQERIMSRLPKEQRAMLLEALAQLAFGGD